jgi:hypothetical protein
MSSLYYRLAVFGLFEARVSESDNQPLPRPCTVDTYCTLNTASNSGTLVPDNKSRNIPEVVVVRRWAVGVLGIWRGRDSWVKGGANGVSLQAT